MVAHVVYLLSMGTEAEPGRSFHIKTVRSRAEARLWRARGWRIAGRARDDARAAAADRAVKWLTHADTEVRAS
jgi:hypothetical protein